VAGGEGGTTTTGGGEDGREGAAFGGSKASVHEHNLPDHAAATNTPTRYLAQWGTYVSEHAIIYLGDRVSGHAAGIHDSVKERMS